MQEKHRVKAKVGLREGERSDDSGRIEGTSRIEEQQQSVSSDQ